MSFDLHLYFQILCASCCRLPQVVTIHGQEELIISGPVAITVAWRKGAVEHSCRSRTRLFHSWLKGAPAC